MRSSKPAPFTPPTLGPNEKGGETKTRHLRDKQADPSKEISFPDHWNEPDVRGVLYAMQGRVCGFCGCYLPRNDRGDVEHYRPKNSSRGVPPNGGYWWLAYETENYLLSCGVCNRTHKKTKFPLLDEGTRVDFAKRQAIGAEQAVLFHPAFDSVEGRIEMDIANGFIDPAVGQGPEDVRRVEMVRDFFQWNLDARLILERQQVRDQVLKMISEGREAEVKPLASRFSKHSLMVMAVLRRTNRLDLAPTAEEETMMFAMEVGAELKLDLAASRKDRVAENQWVMRAMWEVASGGLRTWLEARWDELGCRAEIEALTF